MRGSSTWQLPGLAEISVCQETLTQIQPWGQGGSPEKCGIPGFYRLKCDSITHTKQQFAWLDRDLSRKELVAVDMCHRYFSDFERSNIDILDAKICRRIYKI